MKVGSIVECVDNTGLFGVSIAYGVAIPKLNTPYIVRELFIQNNRNAIALEEIVNPKGFNPNSKKFEELAYKVERFRELQLPDDIEELISNELVNQ